MTKLMPMLKCHDTIPPSHIHQPSRRKKNEVEKHLSSSIIINQSIHILSSNLTVRYWKWPIEIVDLPIKSGDFRNFP